MALRKMLSGRFFHLNKHSSIGAAIPPPSINLRRLLPGSTTAGALNRRILLQQRSISQSGAAVLPTSIRNPSLSIGDNLIARVRSSMMQDRIRIDAFAPPLPVKEEEQEKSKMVISVADLRKLLKASRIEAARAKLRGIPSSYVSYSEFFEICREAAAGSDDCGREIAAALDHSGAVIVMADIVFLRPEQVARAIEREISAAPMLRGAEELKELEELEAKKGAIDRKAAGQVKRELWGGLGLLLIQTAAFMRLTFWELSWDVMEPICFFTTSFYFMLGYAFFLRTAKDPSFEAIFEARFAAKQKRLFHSHSFDLYKFNQLKRALSIDSHT